MADSLTLEKKEELLTKPGYEAFIDALQAINNLGRIEPKNVKWVGANTEKFDLAHPLDISLNHAQNLPSLSINLYPKLDGESVIDSYIYNAPLLLVGNSNFETSGIRNYQVKRKIGVPENKEILDNPKTLAEIVESTRFKSFIDNSTPIIEAIALVPIAPDREFVTEFTPHLSYHNSLHKNYLVNVICQDSLAYFSLLTEGKDIDITRIEQDGEFNNWTAEFVQDLFPLQKIFLPDKTGHMIVTAMPYEKPKPREEPIFTGDYNLGYNFDGFRSMRLSSLSSGYTSKAFRRQVNVGEVNIGKGSQVGQGNKYQGEILKPENLSSIIFHLRLLGIKPESADKITTNMLDKLGKAMNTY